MKKCMVITLLSRGSVYILEHTHTLSRSLDGLYGSLGVLTRRLATDVFLSVYKESPWPLGRLAHLETHLLLFGISKYLPIRYVDRQLKFPSPPSIHTVKRFNDQTHQST